MRLTLTVAGRVGPYEVLTEEAVRGLAEKLALDGEHVVPVRLADDSLALGQLDPATVEVVELTPGRFALHAEVDLDDHIDAPTEKLAAGLDDLDAA